MSKIEYSNHYHVFCFFEQNFFVDSLLDLFGASFAFLWDWTFACYPLIWLSSNFLEFFYFSNYVLLCIQHHRSYVQSLKDYCQTYTQYNQQANYKQYTAVSEQNDTQNCRRNQNFRTIIYKAQTEATYLRHTTFDRFTRSSSIITKHESYSKGFVREWERIWGMPLPKSWSWGGRLQQLRHCIFVYNNDKNIIHKYLLFFLENCQSS